MNLFLEKHKILLRQLIQSNVQFIIIGGYSVIFHGYRRITGDVELWIEPSNENKRKLLMALGNTGISKEMISEINKLNFQEHLVFSFWEKPEKVDLLTHINLVDFEEAKEKIIFAEIDNLKIPFLHLNHLILSKMNTGRNKDVADIEELQRIKKAKDKGKNESI